MNKVRKHVDKLFAAYPKNNETIDLKEEVIGNLEAEIEDLQNTGVSFEEAFRVSTSRMGKLDGLIDGAKSVRIVNVLSEVLQWALIYVLIAWIITIPISMLPGMQFLSWTLFIGVIGTGILFLLVFSITKTTTDWMVNVNLFKVDIFRKVVWGIWILYMIFSWGKLTGLLFGSNIWFSRPVSINGPYQFASIVAMYVPPLLTLIIPLLMNKLRSILEKQEA